MSTISTHNLEPEIERKIKRLANKKHQSINKTVKDILIQNFEKKTTAKENRKRFEKFCGRWSEEDYKEFQSATEDFIVNEYITDK